MNTRHKTCLIIPFIAMTSVFAFQCPINKECYCELRQNIYAINCTMDNNSVFKLFIYNKNMDVDCMYSELSDFNLNMTFSETYKKITFMDCNLSKNIKLIDTARMLGATDIQALTFISHRNLNLTAEKHRLSDFKNLTELKIYNYNIFHMHKDLLANLKKLQFFNLKENNLDYLPAELFDYTSELDTLNLRNNKLRRIEPSTFDKLKNLKSLKLSNNSLTELHSDIFDKLIALKTIDVSMNNLSSLPEDIFAKLKNLDNLKLSENNFTDLPRDFLRNNTKLSRVILSNNKKNLTLLNGTFGNLTKLESLLLTRNGLVKLPEDLFWGSSSLEKIVLSNNYLQSLPVKIFRGLKKLKILELNSNKLEALLDNIFQDTNSLKTLDLSNNRISSISKNLFSGLNRSLEFLYMQQNLLKSISDFHDLFSLRTLNLGYNNISSIKTEDLLFSSFNILVNLMHNNIQHIFLHDAEYILKEYGNFLYNVKILVDNNPLNCNCDIYDFLRYYEGNMSIVERSFQIELDNLICHSPKKLKNVRLDSSNFTCRIKNTDSVTVCPEDCDCFLKPYDKAFIFDCSHKNLTNVPNDIKEPNISLIQNLTRTVDTILQFYLNFSHNQLTQIPDLEKLEFRSMNKLFLSYNDISNISLNRLSRTTKDLELHNNKLSRIHSDVLNFWKNSTLTHLTLHENPWECDCDARDFYSFINSIQTNVEKSRIIIEDTSKIICHRKNISISEIMWDDICQFDTTVIISICAAIALIGLIGIIFGLYHKYQEHIKIWLFARQWCLWFVTEEELDEDKLFDAFVSFSRKDHDFVANELIPNLERSPMPFKLCVHYRNWLGGMMIPANIVISVENSRRTIVVLSPNFLESVWGKMEFRTAHRQALKENRTRVILILYEDIGPIDDLEPELRAYISMNTYIKWGDPWFWDKLRYALPHQSRQLESGSAQSEVLENCKQAKIKNNILYF